MNRYRASYEEIMKDKEDFYAQGGGKETKDPVANFNKLASTWAYFNHIQNGENYDDYVVGDNNKIENYVERWAPPPAKIAVLGTGTGREVHTARELGYDAVGTTFGKENPSFAKWKFGIDLDYVDNNTLPYPSKSFDVVVAFQVFEHCWAPHFFVMECNRILKEGGLLILEWPPFLGGHISDATGAHTQLHDFMDVKSINNLHHMCCWTPAQGSVITRKCNYDPPQLFVSGHNPVVSQEGRDCPKGFSYLNEEDPAFYSNISSGQIVLAARRRPDSQMPDYVRQIHELGV
jgi:SAM-dependent methyltransferase